MRVAHFPRKTRLGPVERLDLAFLVDGDHCRVAGRVHVETDHIIKLGGEVGIVGSLEGPDPVRLELMGGPYALDRSQRKTHRLGHGAAGPMGDCTGRFAQGALNHGMHLGLRHWRDAGRAGLVAQQTLNAFPGAKGTVLNFVCGLGTMGREELSHGPTQGSQDPGCYS